MESVFLNGGYVGTTTEYLTKNIQISTISLADYSIAQNVRTITVPATAKVGDIAVIIDNINTGSAGTVTGWTRIAGSSVSSSIGTGAYYKVVASGDIGATFTSTDGDTTDHFLLCTIWRVNSPAEIASITLNDVDSEATAGNPASDTVTMSLGTPPLIGFINFIQRGSNNGTFSIATTPVADGYVDCVDEANRPVIRQYYKVYDAGTTPENMTGDINDAGAQGMISWYFTFTSQSGINQYNDGIWNLQAVLEAIEA